MKKISTILTLIGLLPLLVTAQWSGDPNVANTRVCTATDQQRNSHIVPDGSGGAIIFWETNNRIFYNRLNNAGNAVWATVSTGLSLTNTTVNYHDISQVLSDGNGGAFVCYNGDDSIFVQRINNTGTKSWLAAGVPLSSTGSEGYMCSDGSGGIIVSWPDYRGDLVDGFPRTFAQRISSTGNKVWNTNGVEIVTSAGFNLPNALIPDGMGGAIVSIIDTRNSNYNAVSDEFDNFDIYAQRINASGNAVWAAAGVPVCTQASNQFSYADGQHPYMVTDGSGGAILCWEDSRNDPTNGNGGGSPNEDIFCQRINANGIAQGCI